MAKNKNLESLHSFFIVGKTASRVFLSLFFLPCLMSCATPFQSPLSENAFAKKQSTDPQVVDTQANEVKRLDSEITFVWPLKDGRVTQEYRNKKGKRRGHKGIDIAAPKGTNVFAAHDGIVIYAGRKFRGFGKFIILESDDGRWGSFYSHLLKIRVKQGRRVKQGQVIGNVGRTGRATGYHLHFEIRRDKEPINPLEVLP